MIQEFSVGNGAEGAELELRLAFQAVARGEGGAGLALEHGEEAGGREEHVLEVAVVVEGPCFR